MQGHQFAELLSVQGEVMKTKRNRLGRFEDVEHRPPAEKKLTAKERRQLEELSSRMAAEDWQRQPMAEASPAGNFLAAIRRSG